MTRRTKIICTLGPSTTDRAVLRRLIEAGMNVARLNFSHGTHDDHKMMITRLREAADELDTRVPILQDLQGPKIRVGNLKGGGVLIHEGRPLVLTSKPLEVSTRDRVYVNHPSLASDVEVGGRILLDDGLLELEVVGVRDGEVITEVVVGGPLRSKKGVNMPHARASAPSLTEKDLNDLEFGLSMDVDLIALSFVRTEADVSNLVSRIRDTGKKVGVIAKIEKPEAVHKIDLILDEADGIMVARGDLGIEIPMAKVPGAQKELIRKSLAAAKPVITATQMLESMIDNPRPTRAEASDVANAVLDGSDAVMLSGETAVGKHPVRVVEAMVQIIEEAERNRSSAPRSHHLEHEWITDGQSSRKVTESVSVSACRLAERVHARAIACLTASGATARAIARHRPNMPIYAFTDDERLVGQLGLLWGTKAFAIPFQRDTDAGVQLVHETLESEDFVASGDLVVLTAGMPLPAKGRTNMVHVGRV